MTPRYVPIQLKFLPKLNLVRLFVDAGNGKGEQTIFAVAPAEAVALGDALTKMGTENRKVQP